MPAYSPQAGCSASKPYTRGTTFKPHQHCTSLVIPMPVSITHARSTHRAPCCRDTGWSLPVASPQNSIHHCQHVYALATRRPWVPIAAASGNNSSPHMRNSGRGARCSPIPCQSSTEDGTLEVPSALCFHNFQDLVTPSLCPHPVQPVLRSTDTLPIFTVKF